MKIKPVRRSDLVRIASGLLMAVTISAVATKPASATLYQWTLSGGGDTGSGFLTTGGSDHGGFDITSFSGEIDGAVITGLLGGQPGGSMAYSPAGAFIYDNILYPSSDSAEGNLLDIGGILFSIAGSEANIWGTSPNPNGYSYYTFASGSYTIADNATAFNVVDPPSPIAEPGSVALFSLGLAGLGLAHLRRSSGCPSG